MFLQYKLYYHGTLANSYRVHSTTMRNVIRLLVVASWLQKENKIACRFLPKYWLSKTIFEPKYQGDSFPRREKHNYKTFSLPRGIG